MNVIQNRQAIPAALRTQCRPKTDFGQLNSTYLKFFSKNRNVAVVVGLAPFSTGEKIQS